MTFAFVEAVVTMLPAEAGGRSGFVLPRDGSYRPFARIADDDALLRVRFIEGPPRLLPGESARVVLEVDSFVAAERSLAFGTELELIELEQRAVGFATVTKVLRAEAV